MEAGGGAECFSSRTPRLKLSLFLFHSVLLITETQAAGTRRPHIPAATPPPPTISLLPLRPTLLHISESSKMKKHSADWRACFCTRSETHHIFPRALVNFSPPLLFPLPFGQTTQSRQQVRRDAHGLAFTPRTCIKSARPANAL